MYGNLNVSDSSSQTGSESAAPGTRLDQAKSEGMEHLNAQRQKISSNLNQFSSALRQTGQSLASSDNQIAVKVVDWASHKVDSLAEYLSTRDLAGLSEDARRFARERPQMFLGGMFLAGVGLARYLRASAHASHMDTSSEFSQASGFDRSGGVETSTGLGRSSGMSSATTDFDRSEPRGNLDRTSDIDRTGT